MGENELYRVLIAEDELLERIGLRYGIHWENYDMTVVGDVANGAEAWNECQRLRPDLLVTDLKMPVMDGMTLIERIRQTDRRMKIVIVSCVEDFATAREAISLGVSGYILKASMNMEEIENVIAQVYSELKKEGEELPAGDGGEDEISLHAWLDGDMSAAEMAALMVGQVKPGEWEEMQVYAVQPITKDGMRPKSEFLLRAEHVMSGVIGEEAAAQKLGASEGCVCWAVYGRRGEAQEVGAGLMEQVRDALKNYLNLEAAFGCSTVSAPSEAQKLAESALDCLSAAFFSEQDVTAADMPDSREATSAFCTEVMNVMQGQAAAQASELFRKMIKTEQTICDSGERIRELACALAAIVRAQTPQHEQAEQLEKECRAEIGKCLRIRAVGRVLCRYLKEMAEKSSHRPQTAGMNAAIRYINSRLCEGPSLNEAAAQAGLSPSYFSACFRRETGMGFNEYLTRMRMDRACTLLTTTDRSVAEIAEELGYYDPSHFIRVFKKAEGVSPRQYRVANRR